MAAQILQSDTSAPAVISADANLEEYDRRPPAPVTQLQQRKAAALAKVDAAEGSNNFQSVVTVELRRFAALLKAVLEQVLRVDPFVFKHNDKATKWQVILQAVGTQNFSNIEALERYVLARLKGWEAACAKATNRSGFGLMFLNFEVYFYRNLSRKCGAHTNGCPLRTCIDCTFHCKVPKGTGKKYRRRQTSFFGGTRSSSLQNYQIIVKFISIFNVIVFIQARKQSTLTPRPVAGREAQFLASGEDVNEDGSSELATSTSVSPSNSAASRTQATTLVSKRAKLSLEENFLLTALRGDPVAKAEAQKEAHQHALAVIDAQTKAAITIAENSHSHELQLLEKKIELAKLELELRKATSK